MRLRWRWAILAGLIVALAPRSQVPATRAAPAANPIPGQDPALIVRVLPIERLLADAKFLAGRLGGAASIQKLDAAIAEMIGGDGLADTGLDLRKPLGLYAVARGDFSAAWFVALVPIADEKAFLGLLDRLEIKAERLGGGLISLAGEDLSDPLFLRFANGYAYVAANDRAAVAPERLVAPGRIFAGDESALASAVLDFDRIPELIRKRAAFQLKILNGFAVLTGLTGQPGADDENGLDHDLDVAQLRALARWAGVLLTDSREVSIRANFDRASGELSFDLGGHGRTGTPLAKTIAALPETKSLFARLVRTDAAANALICSPLLDEHREVLVKAFGAGEKIVRDLDLPEEIQEPAKKLVNALGPTVQAGLFDGGISLRGPIKDRFSVVGGLRLKNARKVEAALLAVFRAMPEDELKKVTIDAAKAGEVAIHQYAIFDDADESVKKVFGNQPLLIAFRDDAVILAFGPDGRQHLEDLLRTAKDESGPAATIDFSVKRLSKLFATLDENAPGWFEKAAGEGLEHVRLCHATVAGGARLAARLAFNLQFLVGAENVIDGDDDMPIPPQPLPPPPVPVPPPPPAPPPP